MDAKVLLLGRRSVSKLQEPAPEGAALERILDAALRSPDHGALRPWRVLLVRGEARARLGEVLAEVDAAIDPSAPPEMLERSARKPLRAPLIAVVVAKLRESAKIPELEQLLSAGCVAHTLVLAAQAEGFGAIWRTGAATYHPLMRERLGLDASDRVIAFVYLGSIATEPAECPRPAREDIVSEWQGPS